jgi:hypothetical protein
VVISTCFTTLTSDPDLYRNGDHAIRSDMLVDTTITDAPFSAKNSCYILDDHIDPH